MGESLTTFTPVQKERYEGYVNETLNSKEQLFGWIDKIPMDGGGTLNTESTGANGITTQRAVHFVSHIGRNATGGFMPPEANYPSAGQQQYVQGYVQGRSLSWVCNVSRAIIARTRTDQASYARAMVESAVRTGNDIRNHEEMMLCGDGSATLATLQAVVVTFAGGNATFTLDNFHDLRKFFVGQFLSIYTNRTNAGTKRSPIILAGTASLALDVVKVVQVIPSTGTPQIVVTGVNGTITSTYTGAGANTPSAGDVISKAIIDNSVATPVVNGERSATMRNCIMGIDGVVLDCDSPMETTFGLHGIQAPTQYGVGTVNGQGSGGATNAAGFPQWTSFVNRSAVNRSLNDSLLQSIIDMPKISYGERPNLLTSSYGGRWEFANSKLGIRRYVNTTEISGSTGGGFKEDEAAKHFPSYDDIPIVPSRFGATWNLSQGGPLSANITALNLNVICFYEWHPVKIVDDDGLTWRMVQRTPFFECIFEHCIELMTYARNAHAKAINILASDAGV